MKQALLTVAYRLTGDPAVFKRSVADAAAAITSAEGLLWKIWGLDLDRKRGLSVYLFEGEAAAKKFAAGPVIAGLRRHPNVADVVLDHAPVDRTLSLLSGAEQALSARPQMSEEPA